MKVEEVLLNKCRDIAEQAEHAVEQHALRARTQTRPALLIPFVYCLDLHREMSLPVVISYTGGPVSPGLYTV